jgi:hypothetical protein
MHAVRWPGRRDGIDWILCQPPQQKLCRRADPVTAGIRNEEVTANPPGRFRPEPCSRGAILQPAWIGGGRCAATHQHPVGGVGFLHRPSKNRGTRRYVAFETGIDQCMTGVSCRVNDRLSAEFSKVLGKFQPTIYDGAAVGRPIVRKNQNFFHDCVGFNHGTLVDRF